jgi:hypothetical protein
MDNSEFVTVRGQNLLANSVWSGGQEFLIIAIPVDRQDSATADIVTAKYSNRAGAESYRSNGKTL